MKELIEIIYDSLEKSNVTLIPKHWRARGTQGRKEFKDLYPYEKQALGKLTYDVIKYYKNERRYNNESSKK